MVVDKFKKNIDEYLKEMEHDFEKELKEMFDGKKNDRDRYNKYKEILQKGEPKGNLGVIVKVSKSRFGFILPNQGGKDIYFKFDNADNELRNPNSRHRIKVGQLVKYEIKENPNGRFEAVNVTVDHETLEYHEASRWIKTFG